MAIDLRVPGRGTGDHPRVADDGRGGPSRPADPPASGWVVPSTAAVRAKGAGAGPRTSGRRRPLGCHPDQDSPSFDAALARSLADLDLLGRDSTARRYYAAGLPWFSALFGRDSLIAALQTLGFDPSIAAGTLRLLAGRQGREDDGWRDEEPGRILHELRVGELARLGEIPHTPYYGTVDSTPLFLIVLAEHADWTGSLDLFRELRPNVDGRSAWIDEREAGDARRLSRATQARRTAAWRTRAGRIRATRSWMATAGSPTPPIALAEVQGYVYAARTGLARPVRAGRRRRRAEALRSRPKTCVSASSATSGPTNSAATSWPCRGMGARARSSARTRARSCSPGSHQSGHARRVAAASSNRHVQRLGDPDPLLGGGRLQPGRLPPRDGLAARQRPHRRRPPALRRGPGAERILAALVAAAGDFEHARLPECFAGLGRDDFGIPVRYPVACHPQAWAAGSVPYLLTGNLGLRPAAFEHRLDIIRPLLPDFIDMVELRGTRIGQAEVDLRFERRGSSADVAITRLDGDLDVVVDLKDPGEGST